MMMMRRRFVDYDVICARGDGGYSDYGREGCSRLSKQRFDGGGGAAGGDAGAVLA